MVKTINTAITERILVTDTSGAPVTGLVNGDFVKTLLKDKVATLEIITVTEQGTGFYYIDFTPEDTGFYEWTVTNATYKPKGWWEYYEVITYDNDTIYSNINDVKTVVNANTITLATHTDSLSRLLGLTQENFYLDTTVFDGSGNMTSGRIRIYDIAGSVGTGSDVNSIYNITTTYDGNGYVETYQVVKQ